MHGMAAQEEVVVDGGQEDAAVVWANRTSLPVSNSPAQDISQSHVTRGECACGKIEPDKRRDTSGVVNNHYIGML